MSVYTSVSDAQVRLFLEDYSVGKLIKYEGIEAGVENTNYFVSTTKGEYVLTIYEDLGAEELPFFLGLMQHLSAYNVPTVTPVANNNNELIASLCDKPAALVERLAGGNVMQPNSEHCKVIGETIGKMHLAGLAYSAQGCRDDNRAVELSKLDDEVLFASLNSSDEQLLHQEVEHFKQFDVSSLPQGIVHSDLFRDNCLFHDVSSNDCSVKISGIIDLYYACNDALLLDIAIVVNDWCFDGDGELDFERYQALLVAYHEVRPITALEKKYWHSLLRISALHFWGFRLLFNLYPKEGEYVHPKDADEFKAKIRWHLANQSKLEDAINSL